MIEARPKVSVSIENYHFEQVVVEKDLSKDPEYKKKKKQLAEKLSNIDEKLEEAK